MQGALLSGNVILTSYLENGKRIRYPIAPLRAAAGGERIGLANLTPDDDQVIRRQAVLLQAESSGMHLPCFAFLVAATFLGAEIAEAGPGRYGIGGHEIRTEEGRMIINYRAPAAAFRMTSFHHVLERARKNDESYFRSVFGDRVVLIGRTDPAGRDYFDVPYTALTMNMMSGVEISAHVINTVLTGSNVRTMGPRTTLALLAFLCLTTAFLSYYIRPGLSASLLTGFLATYVAFAFHLFSHSGYLVTLVVPCLSIPLVYGATFVYRHYSVNRRLREVRNAFGKLVSPSVEEELWKGTISVEPGRGEWKRVTILFSDINDFSPMCEKHSPSEIMDMLNRYFTDAVVGHMEGTAALTSPGPVKSSPIAILTEMSEGDRVTVGKRGTLRIIFYHSTHAEILRGPCSAKMSSRSCILQKGAPGTPIRPGA